MLKPLGTWDAITAKFKESCRTDDWVDRMNHLWTAFLLLFLAVLVSTKQWVGVKIKCWVPAELNKDMYENYILDYCWISNTYTIPMLDSIPVDVKKRQEEEITYYQWVPLILAFQAFLFHFPNFAWNVLNAHSGINLGKVRGLADETQSGKKEERQKVIENIALYMEKWIKTQRQYKHNKVIKAKGHLSRLCCLYCNKREGTFLTGLYLFTKILYLVNVIGQFFLLSAFLSTDYNMYGFDAIRMLQDGSPMRESPRFPRITLCDFEIRQLQNVLRWTVQCVLPINLFNEKIFIFLWFWFFFIAFLCTYSLLKWVYIIMIKRNNYHFVKKYLTTMPDRRHLDEADKKLCKKFADEYLRSDGCFVARTIGKNSTEMVVMDVFEIMWTNFKEKQKEEGSRYIKDHNGVDV